MKKFIITITMNDGDVVVSFYITAFSKQSATRKFLKLSKKYNISIFATDCTIEVERI